MNKIYIACDHAGLELKQKLMLSRDDLPWEDLGTSTTDSVDYPDFADQLSKAILGSENFGVLVCGSGQGISIRANRHSHIRAAICWNVEVAKLARQHNDANVISFGSRTMDHETCEKALEAFLNTPFEGGRHQNRVDKLSRL
ncbi:MAG: ribose 5-phosphate isomerase B [Bdellovibrionales bacterium]|nr:ribose 5-phosphate isomerase B [Bdellovibrionales bacterium]